MCHRHRCNRPNLDPSRPAFIFEFAVLLRRLYVHLVRRLYAPTGILPVEHTWLSKRRLQNIQYRTYRTFVLHEDVVTTQ